MGCAGSTCAWELVQMALPETVSSRCRFSVPSAETVLTSAMLGFRYL
jgi:hypothetical protein